VRPERLVVSLRASFRPEAAGADDRTVQLELDGEPFVVAVRDRALDVRPGTASAADLVVRTDAVTLVRLLRAEAEAGELIEDGVLVVEGGRRELRRFLGLFRWHSAPETT
jgi:ubiquinone biosynthesis protein UbiJ